MGSLKLADKGYNLSIIPILTTNAKYCDFKEYFEGYS